MKVGERIKALRKQRGMALRELSQKAGISISFLSDIENGRSNPSLDRVISIAKGLDVSVSCLLGDADLEALKLGPAPKATILDQRFVNMLGTPGFDTVIEHLHDFDNWSDEDRRELIAYLKAKRMARTRKV